MDWENVAHLAEVLAVPAGRLGPLARPKREASIAEAIGFPSGPAQDQRVYTTLYGPVGDLAVAVGKPGKEAARSGDRAKPHDMAPSLLSDDTDIGYRPSFGDVYSAIQEYALGVGSGGESALHVLGSLFFRNAFMLDHVEVAAGVWRYNPPPAAVNYLTSLEPRLGGLPVEPMLQLIELLALNEDVKYTKRGSLPSSAGRQNNLLTCAHVVAVFLNLASFGQFADGMSRGKGVSPIGQRAGIDTFRLLRWRWSPGEIKFEERLLTQLSPLLGLTIDELASTARIAVPASTRKDRVAAVLRASLRSRLGDDEFEEVCETYNVKTIRVMPNGMPAEDVSFATIREADIVRQAWSTSELRRGWLRPFLFAVFDCRTDGRERLLGFSCCSIPADDLDERARASWEATVEALVQGRRMECPKRSESPFFVRTKDSRGKVTNDGEISTKLGFWLSRDYVKALIEGTGSRGNGAYAG